MTNVHIVGIMHLPVAAVHTVLQNETNVGVVGHSPDIGFSNFTHYIFSQLHNRYISKTLKTSALGGF